MAQKPKIILKGRWILRRGWWEMDVADVAGWMRR
jgi:hypothetical protein